MRKDSYKVIMVNNGNVERFRNVSQRFNNTILGIGYLNGIYMI